MKVFICVECGKQFTPSDARASRPHRFCSISCANVTRRGDPISNFWARVEKTEGCWLWKGGKDSSGYGFFRYKGKRDKAHRVAYELAYGVSLGSLFGCHHCDNPSCVRPDHIFPGTPKDNAQDAFRKGRRKAHFANSSRPGTANGRAQLTEQDVQGIRRLASRGITEREIQGIYNIRQAQINKIIRRVSWKHVPDGEE